MRSKLERLIRLGCFVRGGPVCASFSMAVRPPVRSGDEPSKRSISEKMRVKLDTGNDMALWFFSLVEVALQAGLAIWFENAAASWMFKLPEWQKI